MRSITSVNLSTPARVLAIGAHPDDVEIGCGATLAKWAAHGCDIHHLICTDGSKGSWDPDVDTAQLAKLRESEQRAASVALGGSGNVVFMGWTDGELEAGRAERYEICRWIRRVRPEVVLGHDPWKRYQLQRDHRQAGFLLVDGVVAARDPHFFPDQGEPPHRPSAILLWDADRPDHLEEVGDHVAGKLAALLAHRSQFRSTMGIEDARSEEQLDRFRTRTAEQLRDQGQMAGVEAGEAFKLISRV